MYCSISLAVVVVFIIIIFRWSSITSDWIYFSWKWHTHTYIILFYVSCFLTEVPSCLCWYLCMPACLPVVYLWIQFQWNGTEYEHTISNARCTINEISSLSIMYLCTPKPIYNLCAVTQRTVHTKRTFYIFLLLNSVGIYMLRAYMCWMISARLYQRISMHVFVCSFHLLNCIMFTIHSVLLNSFGVGFR